MKIELKTTNNMLYDIIRFLKDGHIICLHYDNVGTYFYSQNSLTTENVVDKKLVYLNIKKCPSLLDESEWPVYIKEAEFVEYKTRKILPTNPDNIYHYTF